MHAQGELDEAYKNLIWRDGIWDWKCILRLLEIKVEKGQKVIENLIENVKAVERQLGGVAEVDTSERLCGKCISGWCLESNWW